MDDLNLSSDQLYKTLDEISSVNKYLGGHKIVINGIQEIIKRLNIQNSSAIKIVDVGCGRGDSLLALENKIGNNYNLELLGLDANEFTVQYARKSKLPTNVRIEKELINEKSISNLDADVLIFSLFLHHFTDDEIKAMLSSVDPKKVRAILINDLERSSLALVLFRFISIIFYINPMARYDGQLSIKKGFLKKELNALLKNVFKSYSIKRKWAFRYQVTALTT